MLYHDSHWINKQGVWETQNLVGEDECGSQGGKLSKKQDKPKFQHTNIEKKQFLGEGIVIEMRLNLCKCGESIFISLC